MTPKQFRRWRLSQEGEPQRGKKHKGWSQQDAADHFGRSLRTVQSWESGGRPVPKCIQQQIKEEE